MESISWIFDGLGTEIISLIVGLISGGAIGYKIGIHNRIKQSQKAGNNSRQTQISSINYGVNKTTQNNSKRLATTLIRLLFQAISMSV